MKEEFFKRERANYIKKKVEKAKNKSAAIAKLSCELFISQSTVRRDLKK